MRWRQTFLAEVSQSLQQLGMRACPVCGSTHSLSMGRCPVVLIDANFPSDEDGFPFGEDRDGDMTFAVRVECTTCGHLMLFNAESYRTGDEKIMVRGVTEEQEKLTEEQDCQRGE